MVEPLHGLEDSIRHIATSHSTVRDNPKSSQRNTANLVGQSNAMTPSSYCTAQVSQPIICATCQSISNDEGSQSQLDTSMISMIYHALPQIGSYGYARSFLYTPACTDTHFSLQH